MAMLTPASVPADVFSIFSHPVLGLRILSPGGGISDSLAHSLWLQPMGQHQEIGKSGENNVKICILPYSAPGCLWSAERPPSLYSFFLWDPITATSPGLCQAWAGKGPLWLVAQAWCFTP